MERKGISTEKGEFNRWVKVTNAAIRDIRKKIAALAEWLKEVKCELSKPKAPDLIYLLQAYFDRRNAGAYSQKARINNLKEMNVLFNYLMENRIDLIDVNPADKVERPKKDRYVGSFYDADEVNALFDAAKGTKLELPILFGAFYGLRRSEAIGLKWDAIDFEQNTITIRHTVTSCDLDGKRILVASDTTKTKSSMRTLPLVPFMRERLLALKDEQEENRRLCGRSYIKDYIGYVCVNEIGDLIKPHYVTESFPKLLKANELRHIRFHDLRHSCASLLLANGVPMKQIQEWLGHSDFSTTANIYAHLDYSSKLTSADAMLNGLGLASN